MIPKRTFNFLSLLTLSLIVAACTREPPVSPTYDDSNKGKGEPVRTPSEFQNGTATLVQAKAWYYSRCIGDGPVQSIEANLTPDGRPACFLYDPTNEGTGGHNYMVFEKTSRGLKYVGDINGGFRAVPPDLAGNPRLIAYWHFGYDGNRITLYTLKDQFVVTAERIVNDHEGSADNQLVEDLFHSPTVSTDLLARAFPPVPAKLP